MIVTEQFSGQSRQCVVSWWNPGSLSSACSRGFFDKILTDGRLNAVCAYFPRWMQGEGCPKANGKPKTRRAILLTYAGFNQPQIAAMCKQTKFWNTVSCSAVGVLIWEVPSVAMQIKNNWQHSSDWPAQNGSSCNCYSDCRAGCVPGWISTEAAGCPGVSVNHSTCLCDI